MCIRDSIEGAQDAVKEAICEKSRQATADGHRVGIIATDETMEAYRQNSNAASIKSVGRDVYKRQSEYCISVGCFF